MDDGSGASAGEYVIIVDEELGAIKCEGAMARAAALTIIEAAQVVGLGAYGYADLYWLYEDGFQGVQCSAL